MTTTISFRHPSNLISSPEQTHIELGLRLTGIAPLLMNSPAGVDPIHPLTREKATFTSKPKKTIADHERVARLDWELGIYCDDDGPFIPAINVKSSFKTAATKWKLGAAVTRGVMFPDEKLRILYDGPRDRDGLYEAGFRDVRAIKNGGMNGGRTMRIRPRFDNWTIETTLFVNPHEIGIEDFAQAVERAQRLGVGDYRPEFGLFTAELWRMDENGGSK